MKASYSKQIAKNIIRYRKEKKVSRASLAQAIGVKHWRIGAIERCEYSVSTDELINIALALDTPIVNFIYGDDPGVLDVRRHWPRNRALIAELLKMLRTFEEYVESQWVAYCTKVLEPYFKKRFESNESITKENAPKPPWKIINI